MRGDRAIPRVRARTVAARSAVATILLVLAPGVLYPLLGAWALLWLLLVALVVAAAWIHAHTEERAAVPEEPDPAGTVPAPRDGTTDHGTTVGEIALASAAADHDLLFSAVVHWRWAGHVDLSVRNPVAPAVHAVVTRAAEHVRETDPDDHGLTECALGAVLAVEAAVTGTGISVWAEQVRLRLPERDAERIAFLADLRKDRALRLAIREAEQDVTPSGPAAPRTQDLVPFDDGEDDHAFLEPLADEEELDAAAWHGGPGSDIDEDGYESYWWPADEPAPAVAEQDVQVAILRGLVASVEDDQRAEFVDQQARLLEEGGLAEVARRIRDEFPA